MSTKISKGMVLCAGLGTRLLPITESFPKPLVPVLNIPNILHSLHLLERAGIFDVIVNVHHLADQIEEYLGDGKRWGMKIEYSYENLLLGTGGGVKKAESFFDGKPFVLANCDFVTDVDLLPLIETHYEHRALGTMILFVDEVRQKLYSKVGVDERGQLVSLPRYEMRKPTHTGIFTGIHILENETLRFLQEKPSGINEILYPALMKECPERARGDFMEDAYWYDTGDIQALWQASHHLLERLGQGKGKRLETFLKKYGGYEEQQPGVWAIPGQTFPKNLTLKSPLLIGADCQPEENVTLGPSTVLGEGCQIGSKATVTDFVTLGPVRLPSEETSEGAIQFQSTVLPVRR